MGFRSRGEVIISQAWGVRSVLLELFFAPYPLQASSLMNIILAHAHTHTHTHTHTHIHTRTPSPYPVSLGSCAHLLSPCSGGKEEEKEFIQTHTRGEGEDEEELGGRGEEFIDKTEIERA